jgi:hypothetical protein
MPVHAPHNRLYFLVYPSVTDKQAGFSGFYGTLVGDN